MDSATIALALDPLEEDDEDDPGAGQNNPEGRALRPNNVERPANMRNEDEGQGGVRNDGEERVHVRNDGQELGHVRNDGEELGPVQYDVLHRRTCKMLATHLYVFSHNCSCMAC